MARSSDTVGNIVTIVVVVVVGYLGIVFISRTINASKSAATIGSAKGGGSAPPGTGSLANMLKGAFGGKINDGPALDQLFQQLDQQTTTNLEDALSNVWIPEQQYTNPFDAAGISFPIDTTGGGGGGAGSSGLLDATGGGSADYGNLDPSVTTYF